MFTAFDYDTRLLSDSVTNRAALARITAKRGYKGPVTVRVSRNGIGMELPSDVQGLVGVFAADDFDGDYLASANSMVKTGSGSSTLYTFWLDLNTDEINALFDTAGTETSEELAFEILFTSESGNLSLPSEAVPFYVTNSYLLTAGDAATASPGMKATQAEAQAGSNNTHWMTPLRTAEAIAALGGGGGTVDPAPYNIGNVVGNVTPNRNNGIFQKMALTSTIELYPPSNGSEGKILKLWLTASGADRSFDLNAGIKIPSDSLITFPKTLTSGKLYIVLLQHNGTNWMLISCVGGY